MLSDKCELLLTVQNKKGSLSMFMATDAVYWCLDCDS